MRFIRLISKGNVTKEDFISFISGSTALCWALASSLVSYLFDTVDRTPWTGNEPVARPLPTHRTTQTQNKRTYKHAPALYPPGRFLVLISVRGRVDPRATVRLEGLGQLKNPMTSSGMEPATFWLVA
jgi:hypothetical protein